MMWVQYFLQHTHVRSWRNCKSEWNDLILIESIWCYERGLVAVVWVNLYLLVSACQVQLGEYTCSVEFIQQVLDVCNGYRSLAVIEFNPR